MRKLIFIILTFPIVAYSQDFLTLKPTLGKTVNRSLEGEVEQERLQKECENFWTEFEQSNGSGFIDRDKLSDKDRELFDKCAADFPEYWSVVGIGCSWYCGGGQDTQTASSELNSQGNNSYAAKNAHDLSYKTAWVEGVAGHGIGEYLEYHVKPENPRITEIIIVNGYVKSDIAWTNNSRVKKLKMYIDNKPYAILELADTKKEQHFKVEPIGYGDRSNFDLLKTKPGFVMKFEIADVYPGLKYDDTAITEIYFDGIDVH